MNYTAEQNQCPLSMHSLKHSMPQKQKSPQSYQKPSNPTHIRELRYKCLMNEYRLPKSTQFAFTNTELLFFSDRTVRRNYTINVTHKSQLMTITRQNQTSKSEYL